MQSAVARIVMRRGKRGAMFRNIVYVRMIVSRGDSRVGESSAVRGEREVRLGFMANGQLACQEYRFSSKVRLPIDTRLRLW